MVPVREAERVVGEIVLRFLKDIACLFNLIQFILYSPTSQIINLPQICTQTTSHLIRKNRGKN